MSGVFPRRLVLLLALTVIVPASVRAWDYEYHRLVNELALESLPSEFPRFVEEATVRERIAYLAGEPDRWRNSNEPAFRHVNEPDHFFDMEDLAPLGFRPESLPAFREDFVARWALARAKDPTRFPLESPASDVVHVRWLPGTLPWKVQEEYGRLRSGFSTLKAFEAHGGTESEIANARQNVVTVMGVLGHYVGDAGQPLHTTRHYNGWVGPNPEGYTTNRTLHAWIDGDFLKAIRQDARGLRAEVRPARLLGNGAPAPNGIFPLAVAFLQEQFAQVEPLYRAEKDGWFRADGPDRDKGRRFLETQLLRSGRFLGELWYTAWKTAPADTWLQSMLARRALAPETGAGSRK